MPVRLEKHGIKAELELLCLAIFFLKVLIFIVFVCVCASMIYMYIV